MRSKPKQEAPEVLCRPGSLDPVRSDEARAPFTRRKFPIRVGWIKWGDLPPVSGGIGRYGRDLTDRRGGWHCARNLNAKAPRRGRGRERARNPKLRVGGNKKAQRKEHAAPKPIGLGYCEST